MRFQSLLPTIFATSAMVSALAAQDPRITKIGPGTIVAPGGRLGFAYSEEPRAVIGLTTTSAATTRDTLGVLVASVRNESPADKAGIEEGNRIASINGVSLKLAAADVGDDAMAGAMSRRLSRELDKLKPGDDVELRIYTSGQTKTVRVKTIAPEDLYYSGAYRRADDRATLGLNIATTGSLRDTIGVFVMSTEDGSPAAKAGIEEGSRIASINGVDLHAPQSKEADYFPRTSNAARLEREVSRLKPGDIADLRVYYNGQFRNVKVTAARMSDFPRRGRSMTIIGGDNFMTIPPMAVKIDGERIGDEVRRAMETARVATGSALEVFGKTLGRMGNRVQW